MTVEPHDGSLAAKADLHVYAGGTYNADTPAHLLDDPITPVSHFFVRNNGDWPPGLPDDHDDWRFTLDGLVERPLSLTLRELKSRFESITVTSVLECAGNGRGYLDPPVEGVQCAAGAVGCARFTGFRMADLLAAAGVGPGAVYTAHYSPDRTAEGKAAISRGLPLAKALAPETLLAYAMNGEPLAIAHGGPLRVVAPGFPGSAWQKWLTRLQIRDVEHDGAKMTGLDYRLPARPLRPGAPLGGAAFLVIEDMPVKALITYPAANAVLRAGEPCEIRGWAWSGQVSVEKVALSWDGLEWREAALEAAEERWAWRRFRLSWRPTRTGSAVLLARATDALGRSQPLEQAWNPRGYCNNACQPVAVAIA